MNGSVVIMVALTQPTTQAINYVLHAPPHGLHDEDRNGPACTCRVAPSQRLTLTVKQTVSSSMRRPTEEMGVPSANNEIAVPNSVTRIQLQLQTASILWMH